MKTIAAASNIYRLVFFLKYKGIIEQGKITGEIPAHDLGLRFSWLDPFGLYVPKPAVFGWVGRAQRIM